jgi:two-component system LytT family response regulator
VISAIQDEKKHNKIIIKNSDQIYVVKPGDVYYISGCGFYSEVTFEINGEIKTVIVSKPLNVIEIEYAHASFFRIHKSFIVNVNKIANVLKQDGLALKMNDEKIIPVARRRVNSFLSFIK